MNYYYTINGVDVEGPCTLVDLQNDLRSGALASDTQVCAEGNETWRPLSEVVKPASQPTRVPPRAPRPQQPSAATRSDPVLTAPKTTGPPPATAPVYVSGPPASGLAIASLVLAICSLLVYITCVPAVICGHAALSRIKGSGGQIGGRGLALAGLIVGYLFSSVGVIAILTLVGIHLHQQADARRWEDAKVSVAQSELSNSRELYAEWIVEAIKKYATNHNNITPSDLQDIGTISIPYNSPMLGIPDSAYSVNDYEYLVPNTDLASLSQDAHVLRDKKQDQKDKRQKYTRVDGQTEKQ